MPVRAAQSETVDISIKVERGTATLTVLGTTPIILNRLSEKAKHELLLPKGRKTAAERAGTLKHNPYEEFRASPYITPDGSPTYIGVKSETFKAAMGTAALDLPGAKKAQIGRLVFVEGRYVPIYGEPQLLMSIVRSADMNRTPDVRTRTIIPEWCAEISITFARPTINETAIANLLAAAGITAGVGDWRPEKGKGSFGQFNVTAQDDERVVALKEMWGRAQQERAMNEPQAYDSETEELLSWFDDESKVRGFKVAS